NCRVQSGGNGIFLAGGCRAFDCLITGCGGNGVYTTTEGNLIERCVSSYNTGDGIQIAHHNVVLGCTAIGNGQAGIHTRSYGCRIEGNTVNENARGLDVSFAPNLIIRNWFADNNSGNSIAAGNVVGPTVTAANVATSTNPNANYNF